jgi:hypothetical protein
MRGVGKASFPRLAHFLISPKGGGRGIGAPWLTPRTTTSGHATREPRSQLQTQPHGQLCVAQPAGRPAQKSQLHSQHRGSPRRLRVQF